MKNIGLDSNENLYNPYNSVDFLSGLSFEDVMFKYPDNEYLELRKAYADYSGVRKENIIAGNGSDEMLNLIISNYIFDGDIFMTLSPDFGMYDFYVNQNGGKICKYIFEKDNFNIDEFILKIKEVKPKLLIFSNPNNPTGNALTKKEVKKVLDSVTDTKIVVDEAYFEFFGETVINETNNYPNLIVTRTLSKAFGLASIRVGFLISNEYEVEKLTLKKVPFNINRISNNIAIQALKKNELMIESVEKIVLERSRVFEKLKNVEKNFTDLKFYKSGANYIYFEGKDAKEIKNKLNKKGFNIRVFSDEKARITIGTKEQNLAVTECINSLV